MRRSADSIIIAHYRASNTIPKVTNNVIGIKNAKNNVVSRQPMIFNLLHCKSKSSKLTTGCWRNTDHYIYCTAYFVHCHCEFVSEIWWEHIPYRHPIPMPQNLVATRSPVLSLFTPLHRRREFCSLTPVTNSASSDGGRDIGEITADHQKVTR